MMNDNSYEMILNRYSKGGKPVKDLKRFTSLCMELGITNDKVNKDDVFIKSKVKYVHIAGTNGKGSISEYIANTITESGVKTGKFTSPYIMRINERIQIDNEPVSDVDLLRLIKKVHGAVLKCSDSIEIACGDFSQFEILTAATFLYFEEKDCGYAVVETGIGGLLDCTNIITPEISVITAIDYDHSDILGKSIFEIAKHKAGIIKKNVPCVIYPEQQQEVEQVIHEAVNKCNSQLIIPDTNELVVEECSLFGNRFIYENETYFTKMGGRHQVLNAVTAINALNALNINKEYVKKALAKSVLSARMQIVKGEHGKGSIIIVDGAHNPHGLKAARTLLNQSALPDIKVLFIGMMKNKDYHSALSEILIVGFDKVVLCGGFSDGALGAGEILNTALGIGGNPAKLIAFDDWREGYSYAKQLAENGLLLVTGSLYLAGRVLGENI